MATTTPKQHSALSFATSLILELCMIADNTMFDAAHENLAEAGIADAVRGHDTAALFNWFVEALNFQGVSDAIAASYLDQHGSVTFSEVENGLRRRNVCPKLQSHWHFARCGYQKTSQTCSEPLLFPRCSLPRHNLRNGGLNQAVYSLFLFFRDVADGDFVSWLDRRLAEADATSRGDRAWRLADAVVAPMTHIHGVSHKVLNMALSALFMAGDPERERWQAAGQAMVVIDTLIHNWLHRTGILEGFAAAHLYGPGCYRPGGCANMIAKVADRIDARRFNPTYPKRFPRFIEFCIWWFCAESGFNQCNGNRINDRHRCRELDCPVFARCGRVTLQPAKPGQRHELAET